MDLARPTQEGFLFIAGNEFCTPMGGLVQFANQVVKLEAIFMCFKAVAWLLVSIFIHLFMAGLRSSHHWRISAWVSLMHAVGSLRAPGAPCWAMPSWRASIWRAATCRTAQRNANMCKQYVQ